MVVADRLLLASIVDVRPQTKESLGGETGVIPTGDATIGWMQTSHQGQSVERIDRVDHQGRIILWRLGMFSKLLCDDVLLTVFAVAYTSMVRWLHD